MNQKLVFFFCIVKIFLFRSITCADVVDENVTFTEKILSNDNARMVSDKDEDETAAFVVEASSTSSSKKMMFNFAAKAAGAIILDKSPSTAKGFHHFLDDDRDRYGISPCIEKKWVVIGLSEDILVSSIVVANYEKYSSTVREFQVLGSATYPAEEWVNLGKYEASPILGEQTFQIPHSPSSPHTRYVKLKFNTHYGNEDLCTLSQIKVHGTTIIASFQQEVKRSDNLVKDMLNQLKIEDDYLKLLQQEEHDGMVITPQHVVTEQVNILQESSSSSGQSDGVDNEARQDGNSSSTIGHSNIKDIIATVINSTTLDISEDKNSVGNKTEGLDSRSNQTIVDGSASIDASLQAMPILTQSLEPVSGINTIDDNDSTATSSSSSSTTSSENNVEVDIDQEQINNNQNKSLAFINAAISVIKELVQPILSTGRLLSSTIIADDDDDNGNDTNRVRASDFSAATLSSTETATSSVSGVQECSDGSSIVCSNENGMGTGLSSITSSTAETKQVLNAPKRDIVPDSDSMLLSNTSDTQHDQVAFTSIVSATLESSSTTTINNNSITTNESISSSSSLNTVPVVITNTNSLSYESVKQNQPQITESSDSSFVVRDEKFDSIQIMPSAADTAIAKRENDSTSIASIPNDSRRNDDVDDVTGKANSLKNTNVNSSSTETSTLVTESAQLSEFNNATVTVIDITNNSEMTSIFLNNETISVVSLNNNNDSVSSSTNNNNTSNTNSNTNNNNTTSAPSSSVLTRLPFCLDALKFQDFKAKMGAKFALSSTRATGGSESSGSGTDIQHSNTGAQQQENVFTQLMQKIKFLEMSHAIYELYAIQMSECYHALLTELWNNRKVVISVEKVRKIEDVLESLRIQENYISQLKLALQIATKRKNPTYMYQSGKDLSSLISGDMTTSIRDDQISSSSGGSGSSSSSSSSSSTSVIIPIQQQLSDSDRPQHQPQQSQLYPGRGLQEPQDCEIFSANSFALIDCYHNVRLQIHVLPKSDSTSTVSAINRERNKHINVSSTINVIITPAVNGDRANTSVITNDESQELISSDSTPTNATSSTTNATEDDDIEISPRTASINPRNEDSDSFIAFRSVAEYQQAIAENNIDDGSYVLNNDDKVKKRRRIDSQRFISSSYFLNFWQGYHEKDLVLFAAALSVILSLLSFLCVTFIAILYYRRGNYNSSAIIGGMVSNNMKNVNSGISHDHFVLNSPRSSSTSLPTPRITTGRSMSLNLGRLSSGINSNSSNNTHMNGNISLGGSLHSGRGNNHSSSSNNATTNGNNRLTMATRADTRHHMCEMSLQHPSDQQELEDEAVTQQQQELYHMLLATGNNRRTRRQ